MMSTKIIYGLFGDDDIMMDGIKKIFANNIAIHEVYTPFPVHGLDKLLHKSAPDQATRDKFKDTRLTYATFCFGLYGVTLASLMTFYIMNYDWQQDIGGKPSFDWFHNMPAFVPVMFELTVFCAAHLTCWVYMFINNMYFGAPAQNPDPRTTDDKFLVEIISDDLENVKKVLIDAGVEEITIKDA
ncbi:MAG: DUF3341 domain-containing protein [Flavobacteriaceae bacterium]|nr:MAG: DUF3341 domain-containing protein [Flavobacteriaceae bacterium]